MPKLYVLVGVPGSGKSTWVDNNTFTMTCACISTDKYVEHYANEVGKTYSEVFTEFMPNAVKLMTDEVIVARELGRDIVWDQTSTTVKSRAKKLYMLPNYRAIAVVFPTPEHKELVRRLSSRWDSGKVVPEHVVASMIASWEEPTLEEGFDEIWTINN
jgi:predicted kinase